MLTTYQQRAKAKLITILVSVLVIAGVVVLADHMRAKSRTTISSITQNNTTTPASTTTNSSSLGASTSTTPNSSVAPSAPSSSTANPSTYKNGTYFASSDYYVPHGNESIQVNITLSDGVITNSSIQNSENDGTSAFFQENFASAYKSSVVGKKISGLQLSSVAGASDTTQAFNDALSQIAAKARA